MTKPVAVERGRTVARRKRAYCLTLLLLTPLPALASNPEIVVDFVPGIDGIFDFIGGTPELVVIAEVGYFRGRGDTEGVELYRTDGTAAGTEIVKDISSGSSSPEEITALGGELFFAADDGVNGEELWKSDGTETGTVLVRDIVPGSVGTQPSFLTVSDGVLYFQARDGLLVRGWYRSDGTEAGTSLVKQFESTSAWSDTLAIGATVFMSVTTAANGRELWKSDGTEAGTVLVKDINVGSDGSEPGQFVELDGILYFAARDQNGDPLALWRSDGTEAGTTLVLDQSVLELTVHDGALYFVSFDGATGNELWTSDGTEAGSMLVQDIWPGSFSSSPDALTSSDNGLYFVANDGATGDELYLSDGTPGGTGLVIDLVEGAGSGVKSSFPTPVAIGGNLYFGAFLDGELWVTNGVAEGTTMFDPIRPGGGSPSVEFFDQGPVLIGGDLMLKASDGVTGNELWRLDLNPPTLDLSITAATCPGPGSIAISGGQPDGIMGVFVSSAEGTLIVPGAVCGGTEINLDAPTLLRTILTDESGGFAADINLPASRCGFYVQVVDVPDDLLGPCERSNTQQIPPSP